ncbi:MAG: NCS2 family permease [Leptospiraceae bacterium]|nr:NCS2 family permease [Leptospiraceae bacterium]
MEFLDRWFSLSARSTNLRTELVSGLTTFLTMSYILAVNPLILSAAGMDRESVFFATAISAGITSILMGLSVNVPVALAPGMGLNAYFVAVVAGSQGAVSYQVALAAVFFSGIIFLVLTLTKIRPLLVDAFPESLKSGIAAGIGLFLILIGFKTSGLLAVSVHGAAEAHSMLGPNQWEIQAGNPGSVAVILALTGLALLSVGAFFRWSFSILATIALLTAGSIFLGETPVPSADQLWHQGFDTSLVGVLDFGGMLELGLLTVVFTFTFVELFDSFGTLVATLRRAGFAGSEEKKTVGRAMIVDAIGISLGAFLGTSTVTAYIESAAGIAAGGRSGISAIVTGVLFLLSLFAASLFLLVPASATAPALIFVGMLMLTSIGKLDFEDPVQWIPSVLIVLFMPFTYNIANGIAAGVMAYMILAIVAGRIKSIHWLLWLLAAIIVARYSIGGIV